MSFDSSSYDRVLDFIGHFDSFLLLGHKEPDGDCVGSQLALASFLRRRGKEAFVLSAGPFTRTEIAPYAPFFTDAIPDAVSQKTALIVLDCSSLSRTGSLEAKIPPDMPLAFIDHHAAGDARGSVQCIDTHAPAVTFMIQLLIEAAGEKLSKEEAELLLFGLCTDTGFFRHLDQGSEAVFASISRLVAAGASPKHAFAMMNGGKPFASRKLMGEILSRTMALYDGKLLISWMTLADQERYGLVGRDSDMLYQLLMTVEHMEVAIIVRQESASDCTVGFRSRESIDVAAVAAIFGGGGHRLASGLHMPGQAEQIRDIMIAAFEPIFQKKN